MANCCYERYCLLNPFCKCCFRYCKAITLEIIMLISQLICSILLIVGKAEIPWKVYNDDSILFRYCYRNSSISSSKIRKILKGFYTAGLITGLLKLAFFIIVFIFRLIKIINGAANTVVLVFCYIIYHLDNLGSGLLVISLIIIISDFSKIYTDSKHLIDYYGEYPAVLLVLIICALCDIFVQIPFMTDIQLIRFKTDLSYDEYKNQKKLEEQQQQQQINIQINNTADPILNNLPQGENPTTQNNSAMINETNKGLIVPPNQNNYDQQKPQNQ